MTDAVKIVPVTTKQQQKQFIRFAWELYEGDKSWVPPLIMDQKELLNYKKHPFYETAEIQTFLALRGGKVCGRIAAIVDHAHNKTHDELRGMFGFYESVNDAAVSNALFDSAKEWFARREIHMMRGPMNPSMNYTCSLLIDGFDKPPTFMMTYNKPYYAELIEGYGFKKTQDLFAFWGKADMLTGLDPKLLFVALEAKKRFNVHTRRIEKKTFNEDVTNFVKIYNEALPGTWGFVPLSEGEIKHMAAGLKHLIIPEMTAIAEVEGKAVGCVFGLLDYNPLIKEIDGKLFPFGFLKLLFKRKTIKKIRLVSTNVVPKYQMWGLSMVLVEHMLDDVLAWGITEAEFSWVLESNRLSRGTLERGGAILEKTYRIYDYEG